MTRDLTLAVCALAALAASSAAQIPVVSVKPFRLEVGRCYDRVAPYPDPERVEPHLPTQACVTAVTGTLAFAEDGTLLTDGAAGPSPRAGAAGNARYGVPREFEAHQERLTLTRSSKGYHAWFVADETPEDPAGDTGRVVVEFDLDRGGAPVAGSVSVSGRVECTFAPVCRDEDLVIDYEAAPPAR